MKNKIARANIFLLAILTVLTFVTSCQKQIEKTDAETTVHENDGETSETETGYVMPKIDYENYEFRILGYTIRYALPDMTAENITGEPVNDAIYRRNSAIEENFNIKITETQIAQGQIYDTVNRSYLVGEDNWDLVFGSATNIGPKVINGIFYDLNSISALNLDADWWDNEVNAGLEIDGKLLVGVTNANIGTYDTLNMFYFCKSLQTNLELPDMYELLRENKWTIDTMYELTRLAAIDLNGNGVFDVNDDTYGAESNSNGTNGYFYAAENRITEIGTDGAPRLVSPGDRLINTAEKIRTLTAQDNDGGYIDYEKAPGRSLANHSEFFVDGRVLFTINNLGGGRLEMREKDDYGILPYPKYDERQEKYHSVFNVSVPLFCIPKTVADPERTGTILEAMTGMSAETLLPAYFDITLERKVTRDEESVESLQMIIDGRLLPSERVYGFGKLNTAYVNYMHNISTDTISVSYAKLAESAVTEIDTFIKAFRESN